MAVIDDYPSFELGKPAPVLIELESGRFAAITALPDFVASLVVRRRGVSGLVYREVRLRPKVAEATENVWVPKIGTHRFVAVAGGGRHR